MTPIKLRAKCGNDIAVFTLKAITVAEENRIREAVFGLTDKEQEEKVFGLTVSALTEFSTEEIESISFDENGKEIKLSVSVKEYFSEQTPFRERIAGYVLRSWLLAMQPSIDFL